MAAVYQLIVDNTPANYGQGKWVPIGKPLWGTDGGDGFGLAVALSANGYRVAVGASQKKTSVGYVRIYDYDHVADVWNQVGKDLRGAAYLDKFGTEVQLSADGLTLAVGVIASDANGDDSGHVQVFDLANL